MGRVLTQSDLARVCKESLPQPEYQDKLVEHIQPTYQTAQVKRQRGKTINHEELNR